MIKELSIKLHGWKNSKKKLWLNLKKRSDISICLCICEEKHAAQYLVENRVRAASQFHLLAQSLVHLPERFWSMQSHSLQLLPISRPQIIALDQKFLATLWEQRRKAWIEAIAILCFGSKNISYIYKIHFNVVDGFIKILLDC